MRNVVFMCCIVVLAVSASSFAADQSIYAFFYSRSSGQDAEINLVNTTAETSEYVVRAYDAWGALLWEKAASLAPYDAAFYVLGEVIPEGDSNWGVVVVISQQALVIAGEYSIQGLLHSIDVISQPLAIPEAATGYINSVYHTEASDGATSLFVLNPWSQEIAGRLTVYKSDGTPAFSTEVILAAHESNSYNLAQLVGQDTRSWGLAEVTTSGGSVVIACKYFRSGILRVENNAQNRPIAVTGSEATSATPADPSTPTGKED
ncbi:hypothetical protein ACFLS5_01755 [Candidatus Bipolaricaulota bacterium]